MARYSNVRDGIALALIVLTPGVAAAQSVASVVGLLNIAAGVILVAAYLNFIGGFIFYLVKLGTDGRIEGIKYMYDGVMTLFFLVVLLGIIELVQRLFS